MNTIVYETCCHSLFLACLTNYQIWPVSPNSQDRFSHFLYNTIQAVSIGLIFDATIDLLLKENKHYAKSFCVVFVIPITLSITLSGLVSAAKQMDYFSHELETVERKIGKILDISIRISSIGLLILLATYAKTSKFNFGLATGAVAINLYHGWTSYSADEGIHEQIGQREG